VASAPLLSKDQAEYSQDFSADALCHKFVTCCRFVTDPPREMLPDRRLSHDRNNPAVIL